MFVRKFKLGQDDNQSTISASAKKLPTQNQFRVGNSCYVLILVINYFAAEAAAATSDAAASAVEAADAATASTADAAAATSDAAA